MEQVTMPEILQSQGNPVIPPLPVPGGGPKTTSKRKWMFGVLMILVVGGGLFYFLRIHKSLLGSFLERREVRAFSVADKISRSAAIVINLPAGLSPLTARTVISFEPELKGDWENSGNAAAVQFRPAGKLDVGKYYTVRLAAGDGEYRKDFLADEDPEVAAIFPKENSETNEHSAITLVFNRPMVALTTLQELDQKDVPVEITPKTFGKFKWISTRNLQFIPERRLIRSSRYTVKLKKGLESVDGLAVPVFTQAFTTRPLRYENISQGVTVYNAPIRIVFNEPVDLDRTKSVITVENTTGPNAMRADFVAEYGMREIYDPEAKKTRTVTDRSILEIYNKADRHGRAKFWDFENSYRLNIAKAYPAEGDMELNENRTAFIRVTRPVDALSADSPRTKFAAQDMFDPQGKLWVSFFEPVDLDRLEIDAPALKATGYGEKCKEPVPGEEVQYDDPNHCEKEPDDKKIYLSFDEMKISRGQKIPVTFKKIVNNHGLQLNIEPITETLIIYGEPRITRTVPTAHAVQASLTELKLCTSTPLTPLSKEDFALQVTATLDVQFNSWYPPYRIYPGDSNPPCAPGEFVNTIAYGLIPESPYHATLKLTDDFGQLLTHEISFTTGRAPETTLNFFHYQEPYIVTTPEKTKLTYAVQNMEYVNLYLCKVAPEKLLAYLNQKPSYSDPPSTHSCLESAQDTLQFPKKFWVKNFFTVDLAKYTRGATGHWILTFSHPEYRESWGDKKRVYERSYVTVTRLAAVEKRVERGGAWGWQVGDNLTPSTLAKLQNLYWVSRLNTLEPVGNARVDLYAEGQDKVLYRAESGITGSDGIAKTPTVLNLRGAVITASDGVDSTLVSNNDTKLNWAANADSANRAYVYTDRPIYKPGDEVYIKGLYRVGYDGSYEIFRDKTLTLEVFNSNEENVYKKENIAISEYGTFNDHFVLNAAAALGTYRIRVEGAQAYATFDVEEYVPAPFKVEAKAVKDEYIAGDTMDMHVDANYYFGVPVEGGEVSYSLVSQNYYFDRYKDEYFNFGGGWYDCVDGCTFGDKFILRGKVSLGADGQADIHTPLDFGKFFKVTEDNSSKIFVAYITVKNRAGQSVSTQQSLIVHRGQFYLGVNTDKYFIGKAEPFSVRVKSVDTQGREVSISQAVLDINKITWKSFRRREVDGAFYSHWERVREGVASENLSTDAQGNWSFEFRLQDPGEYEIAVHAIDKRGNPIKNVHALYLYGEGAASVQPVNDTSLDVIADKSNVKVGEDARIVVKSPYDHAKALIAIERGQVIRYEVVDINQNFYAYTVPITERYLPNIFVSVTLLSPKPEVKFGQVEFRVDADRALLHVDVFADKTFYLPGERVTLRLETRNYLNQPVPAEVSLAVVDSSVLALKGNPKKNPLVFFYGGFPLTVSTGSNLKNILQEVDVASLEGDKGGGGTAPQDLTRKKRGVFRDTAFWQADVRTDDAGRTEISFTLPDNLTTWQTEAVGLTRDTKVGVGYKEFTSRKKVMVVPLKPRFVIPGDEFSIGATVFNQTDVHQLLIVNFDSKTLEMSGGDQSQTLALDPGKSDAVYYPVRAPKNIETGEHVFTVSAKNDRYQDTVEQAISITRDNTYETVATAGFTQNDSVKEFVQVPAYVVADRGGLIVNGSATLAVFLSDALNYLAQYPYGCSEQIASKLSAIGVLKRGLAIKNVGDKLKLDAIEFEGRKYSMDEVVEIGLNRVYENETTTPPYPTYGTLPPGVQIAGGFSYYKGLQSNYYLTLHVLNALVDLQGAGYVVRQDVLDRTVQYVVNSGLWDQAVGRNRDAIILGAYALSRIRSHEVEQANFRQRLLAPVLTDQKFLNEDISSETLAYLAILLATDNASLAVDAQVFKNLENRIEIDSRGAYIGVNQGNTLRSYYETSVKDTALFVKAVAAMKSQNPIIDKTLRWLLKNRDKDGVWSSTQNTLAVIDAFTDYLTWQRETESNFTLTAALDDKALGSFDFNSQTILGTFTHAIPMSDIALGTNHTLTLTRTPASAPLKRESGVRSNFYYDASLTYYLSAAEIQARDEGFTVTRAFYGLDDKETKTSLREAKMGDVLRGHLVITVPKSRTLVSVEDFIPAGFEIVNMKLATEDQSLQLQKDQNPYFGNYEGPMGKARFTSRNFLASLLGTGSDAGEEDDTPFKQALEPFVPDRQESHNDRIFLFKESLQPGVYEYNYFVRALIPGSYTHLPAHVEEMYLPENFGRTAVEIFKITM